MIAPDANGWLPIETAPKTRGAYLVFCSDRLNTYVVTWRDEPYWGEPSWFHFGPGNDRLSEEPTHWHPLPKAPVSP